MSLAASPARSWWALAAALALGSLLAWVWPGGAAGLAWRPELALDQPWRAWTAAFVHLSPLHLGVNLAGLVLVAGLGHAAACTGAQALAWALAWPLGHLALSMQPELVQYGGLSGVLHAGVAVVALRLLMLDRGLRRTIGAALALGLVAKIALESPAGPAVRQVPGWDIPLAPLAHAAGAAAGAVCGGLAAWAARQRRRVA